MSQTKKIQKAWCMYDWANSAYNLVITSTVFPAYYIAITTTEQYGDRVSFFGWEIINSSLLNYGIAFAYLVIAFLSPILSAIADLTGRKKSYMQFFSTLGAFACIGLYFFKPGNLELGIILSIIAAIGFCGSLVFYNAYLPEIASPKEQNRLSAKGFTYGYIGSVLLQIICLTFLFINFNDDTFGARLSFLAVGLWWLFFAQISIRKLPNNKNRIQHNTKEHNLFTYGFRELKVVFTDIKKRTILSRFLLSFFFYSMGVQTVMLAAAEFGKKEIKKLDNGNLEPLGTEELVIAILLIQLVAILGANIMARLAKKWGNINVLILAVVIWIAICILAYFTQFKLEFYALAVLVGLVMGGIQSMSRSTYSQLIPEQSEDNTSYFSFYDVTEKMAIVIGMFSFAFIEHITGNMRMSIFALGGFFILGLICLIWMNKTKNASVPH